MYKDYNDTQEYVKESVLWGITVETASNFTNARRPYGLPAGDLTPTSRQTKENFTVNTHLSSSYQFTSHPTTTLTSDTHMYTGHHDGGDSLHRRWGTTLHQVKY